MKLAANLSAPPAATAIIPIRSGPTASSPFLGIRATCRAASSPTSSKTSASAATTFISKNSERRTDEGRFPTTRLLVWPGRNPCGDGRSFNAKTQSRKGRQRRPLLLLFCRGFPRLGDDFFEVNFHRRRKGSAGVPPAESGDPPDALTSDQRIPRATQSFLQTQDGCQENVQFSGFNLLDCARIHVHQFGELFLRQPSRDAFAAHVCAERGQLRQFCAGFSHAPLGRGFCLQNTAQWGVIFA